MRNRKTGIVVLFFSAMLMSVSVFGQGRGMGDGSGQGRGKQHVGKAGQKKVYKSVTAVEVYSAQGNKIYPAEKKSKGSKGVVEDKIDRVETNQNGIRVYFVTKNDDQRVIEFKCKDCILLVDHRIVRGAMTD